jgi:hypothetical protein
MQPASADVSTREVERENQGKDNEQGTEVTGRAYCALHPTPRRVFAPGVTAEREEAINLFSNKWVNHTVLHYYFFDRATDGQTVMFNDGTSGFRSWVGAEEQRAVVRRGFETWKNEQIGVEFREVAVREEAEIRIGFMRGDGAWSWLGREILIHNGPNERTMNFGWDLTRPGEVDTAIHEIGHTLGFPHEHQNPKSGIEWDEEAVYTALAKPPNEWDRQKTFWNIIRKLDSSEVEGTTWDPDSIMHYPFEKGLIKRPAIYFENGLQPHGGLSAKDKSWVKTLYPPSADQQDAQLKPSESVLLNLAAGEQRNFIVLPQESAYFEFRTFGTSDSVMVLFEDDNGELRYRTGDDDSGEDTNAYFRYKLIKGRKYVLRIRLYYSDRPGQTAVMMW